MTPTERAQALEQALRKVGDWVDTQGRGIFPQSPDYDKGWRVGAMQALEEVRAGIRNLLAVPPPPPAGTPTSEREGVWNPNGEGQQPDVPGGIAKDHAREKHPVIAYACLYPRLAAVAREHGYALAMHGSLVADCDLIAVPWIEDAKPHSALVRALAAAAGGLLLWDTHGPRPAGVRKHIIHLGGGPYLDLAVFDPLLVASAPVAPPSGASPQAETSANVRALTVHICKDCLNLRGEMCNEPGCRFCRRTMVEVAEYLDVLLIRPRIDGVSVLVDEGAPLPAPVSPVEPEPCVWRAIATVPKDGTRILLTPAVWTAERVVSAYYRLGMWWIESADARGSIRAFTDPDEDASHWPFTHWTPLPGAPLKVER